MKDSDSKSGHLESEVRYRNHRIMLTVCLSLRVWTDFASAESLFIIHLMLALPMLMYVKLIPKR